jgi:hypothetical protein
MLRILLFFLRINWLHYRPADCLPYACFCETVSTSFIRQPINAYSNLGYIIVGIAILIYLKKTEQSRGTHAVLSGLTRRILILFGVAYIIVGIGSFLYHATFIFFGEEMDDDSMYLIGIFLLLFEYSRIRQISTKQFLWIYFSTNTIFEIIIYFLPVVRGGLFVGLMLILFWIEWKARQKESITGEVKLTDQANLCFFMGYIFWLVDKLHIMCFPDSIFQGHAVWHLMTAYAGWVMLKAMDVEYLKRGKIGKFNDPILPTVKLKKLHSQK